MLARMPSHAATKGIIVASALDSVRRRAELSEWTNERVLREACGRDRMPGPFESVPFRDHTRILLLVARLLRGDEIGEGLRELGRQVYPNFAATLLGRMLFGALRGDPARLLMMGPNGWKVCENFGSVSAQRLAPARIRYEFLEHPIELIETMYVGTLEGVGELLDVGLELGIASSGRRTLLDIGWQASRA